MQKFEEQLARDTAGDSPAILGAIGLVVDGKGNTLYHYGAGRQSLDSDAPLIDLNSTIVLGSAGKFITHIAALQLVEQGLVTLDEPLSKRIPELELLPLVRQTAESGEPIARRPVHDITLRHLLLHTSGLSTHEAPLVDASLTSGVGNIEVPEDAHPLAKHFSIPLIFEPGEGFSYGHSIHWTQLLVTRLAGSFMGYISEHIFNPLGMTSSTYGPRDRDDVWSTRLRMVEREGDQLVPADDASQGLTCSMLDMGAILADLVSPTSKLLKPEHIDLLFAGQLGSDSSALKDLRDDPDNYAFCAGKGRGSPPLVNWTAAGLVIEEELQLSGMPRGTVTWEGMPNVLWAINREKGLGMFFATQLIPVGDEKANRLALMFMKDAWSHFAQN